MVPIYRIVHFSIPRHTIFTLPTMNYAMLGQALGGQLGAQQTGAQVCPSIPAQCALFWVCVTSVSENRHLLAAETIRVFQSRNGQQI